MPDTTKETGKTQATTKEWLTLDQAATKARLKKQIPEESQLDWQLEVSVNECPAKNAAWDKEMARRRNQLQHIVFGNQYCPHCFNFLGSWTFLSLPAKFKSVPVELSNGMLVHHSYICRHHTSIWYYRRGVRKYDCLLHKPETFSEPTACGGGGHQRLAGRPRFPPFQTFL